jgi:Ca2+-binding RTX toxin-like protein
MASFTLTTTPGAAYIGTEGDDTFFVPSFEAWTAAGRTINGGGGNDTLSFGWSGSSTQTAASQLAVPDASFAGVSNVEALNWSPGSSYTTSPFFIVTMGAVASAAFSNGISMGYLMSLSGQGLTVPVNFQGGYSGFAPQATASIATGSGNDTISSEISAAQINAGPGNDTISIGPLSTNPFAGIGAVAGGPGYDVLITYSFATLTAEPTSGVTGIEEIRTASRFSLLDTTPTALTGLDSNGLRNALVLRPYSTPLGTTSPLNLYASDDGRASYDGRIMAYGDGNADTVRGSSTGDYIEGGGGADNLSGEAGNDWLMFQDTPQLTAAARVAGGAGYDILALRGEAQGVTDAAFAKVQGIEELRLLGTGAQSVTLGANSDAAFAASSFGAGSVSAANATSLSVNAAGTSRALSVYGTGGNDTFNGGEGADYFDCGRGIDTVLAGGGADHVYVPTALNFFPPGLDREATPIDGGTGYDLLLLDGVPPFSAPANFASTFVNGFGSSTPINGPIRNFEELRLLGTGSQQVSLTLQQLFAGSETGYATITAPNAASLTANLTGFTMGAAVYGTAGNDVMTAGLGRDYLLGGAGADRFNFAPGCSVDVIADFATGSDRIGLSGFAGITDFAAVQARASVVGGNLQIGLNANDAIILAGVTAIAAGDFLFA